MRPLGPVLTLIVLLAALPAYAQTPPAALAFVNATPDNEFVGDQEQPLTLGEIDVSDVFPDGINVSVTTSPGPLSLQVLSVSPGGNNLSSSSPGNFNGPGGGVAIGYYYILGTFDPTLFPFGFSDIGVSVSGEPGTGTNTVTALASPVVDRLFPTATPTLLSATLTLNGLVQVALPPLLILPDVLTAQIDWGDGVVTSDVVPVVDGALDVSPDDHKYQAPGEYPVEVSFLLDGTSYSSTETLDVAAPEPAPMLVLPLGFGVLVLLRGARRPGASTMA